MLTLSSGEQIIYQTDSRTVTASGSTTQETQTVFPAAGRLGKGTGGAVDRLSNVSGGARRL